MLLLINNSKNVNKLSYIHKLRNALLTLKIPYYEITKIDDDIEKLKHKIKGIILSGSPIKLTKQNNFEDYAYNIHYLLNLKVPVLGICFGSQLLHILNGGKLVCQKKYFCESADVELSKHKLFANITDSQMQFCFSDLPIKNSKIKEIAWFHYNGKRIPCAFEFNKKTFACLFHPEFLESSHQILKNFAKLVGSI